MTRREKFRAYISRVAAAANPTRLLEQRLYVHPPRAISDLIVARLEIDPSSRHLVVGGVGAGKSTQLIVATEKLDEQPDMVGYYLDISTKHDLSQLRPGALVALAGMKFQEREDIAELENASAFKSWAQGYWTGPYDDYDDHDDGSSFVHGVVKPPKPEWGDIPSQHVEYLAKAHEAFASSTGRRAVFLFDSLDRITDLQAFSSVVEHDTPALRHAGVGVVVVGPIRALAKFGRMDADRFDYTHAQMPIDIDSDEKGRAFLGEVLTRRGGEGMLTSRAISMLVQFSGGVLRDLLSLAKAAGDEAYLDGSDVVDERHVSAAADNYGRSLMIGLKSAEIDVLNNLRKTGTFVLTSESDLALMATRRVLEYREGSRRFAVHPTLVPLLAQLAGEV